MDYVYAVTVVRSAGYTDRCEYAVIAPNAARAVEKAIKQAQHDSGFRIGWDVAELAKGNYVVT